MKKSKQILILSILATGRYKFVDGILYNTYYGNVINAHKLPNGYSQYVISDHFSNKVVMYKHILIYLYHNGQYEDGFVIDHIDRDKTNDNISNLRAVSQKVNANNRAPRNHPLPAPFKTIRNEQIQQIRALLKLNYSQSAIARQLNLNRLSVRYTIKNIQAGKVLKYELLEPSNFNC